MRRRISEGGGFVDAEDPLGTDGEQAVETNILAADGFQAIGLLPEAQRETVLLVYGEGYSYAEAASTLGIPIGTVISRLVAARSSLGVGLTYNASRSLRPPCRQNLMNHPIFIAGLVFCETPCNKPGQETLSEHVERKLIICRRNPCPSIRTSIRGAPRCW